MDWLTEHKLPLGKGIKIAVDWLNAHARLAVRRDRLVARFFSLTG